MKNKFLHYYMGIAELTAQLSSAQRLKVGAVIVRDHQILGTGYNGTPMGWDNVCEDKEYFVDGDVKDYPYEDEHGRYKLKTKPEVAHAEMNTILRMAKNGVPAADASLFVTTAPCIECAKLINLSGIKNVYYRDAYRSLDGVEYLKKCSVDVIQI